jgi:hypothetical protein
LITCDAQGTTFRATARAPRSNTCDKQLPRATAWLTRTSTCFTPRASAWAPTANSVM